MLAMIIETEPRAAFHKQHRAHDAAEVARRWQVLAKKVGAHCSTVHEQEGGLPVLAVESGASKEKRKDGSVFYVCAGVHGDEPAGVWGALLWAESRLPWLRKQPWLCFPCFNPWGLSQNVRVNEKGQDLNRSFNHPEELPHIKAWHQAVEPWKFRLAITLHEDFDARGLYAYELTHRKNLLTPTLINAAASHVPRDLRGQIEGHKAKQGIISPRRPDTSGMPGHPEAFVLHHDYSRTTITFESPSEFGFYERVQAHMAFLNAAAAWLDENPHE